MRRRSALVFFQPFLAWHVIFPTVIIFQIFGCDIHGFAQSWNFNWLRKVIKSEGFFFLPATFPSAFMQSIWTTSRFFLLLLIFSLELIYPLDLYKWMFTLAPLVRMNASLPSPFVWRALSSMGWSRLDLFLPFSSSGLRREGSLDWSIFLPELILLLPLGLLKCSSNDF